MHSACLLGGGPALRPKRHAFAKCVRMHMILLSTRIWCFSSTPQHPVSPTLTVAEALEVDLKITSETTHAGRRQTRRHQRGVKHMGVKPVSLNWTHIITWDGRCTSHA